MIDKSVLSSNIIVINHNSPLSEVLNMIINDDFIVVVDDDKKIVGVVNYGNLAKVLISQLKEKNDEILNIKISNYVNKCFSTIKESNDIEEIIKLIIVNKLENLIVVDDNEYPIYYINVYNFLEDVILRLFNFKESTTEDNIIKNLIKEITYLNEQSTIDQLTGLFNYRYFNKIMEEESNRAIRYKQSVSIIFMDIDHFKHINDTYGHECGNLVLSEIGKLFSNFDNGSSLLRRSDIAVRYGGEEFVIICPSTNKNQAFILAERIRKTIEENIFIYNNTTINVTISIGVSEFNYCDNKNIFDILKEADTAMYNAKSQGRNKVVLYNE